METSNRLSRPDRLEIFGNHWEDRDDPVSQRFVFPRGICSPEHWALVLCVPPSLPHKTIQCYMFPSSRTILELNHTKSNI